MRSGGVCPNRLAPCPLPALDLPVRHAESPSLSFRTSPPERERSHERRTFHALRALRSPERDAGALAGGAGLCGPSRRAREPLRHHDAAAQRDRRAAHGARDGQRDAGSADHAGIACRATTRCGCRAPTTPASRPRAWWRSGSSSSKARPATTSAARPSSNASGSGRTSTRSASWASSSAWAAPATGIGSGSRWTESLRGGRAPHFFRMFEDGLIYRGNRLVNWDCHLQTSGLRRRGLPRDRRGSLLAPALPGDRPEAGRAGAHRRRDHPPRDDARRYGRGRAIPTPRPSNSKR
jgi:hypothetical protein